MLKYGYNKYGGAIMKNVSIEVKDEVFSQVNDILENCGMDMEIAIKMFFKRLIKEGSMAFIMPQMGNSAAIQATASEDKTGSSKIDRGEMRKILAIRLFRERGRTLGDTVTYSSKNRTTHNFWANPSFSVLKKDWTLILNDWVNRKIYLFVIPKNSITRSMLIPRNDQKDLIDLQILENVPGFVDKRSAFSFKPFLRDELEY